MPWSTGLEELLARTLSPLVARRVPVRSVSPGPVEGVARVRWADGTILLARSLLPGSLVRISRALADGGSIVAVQVEPVPEPPQERGADPLRPVGVVVTMQLARRRQKLSLLVLGLDQPD